MLTRPLGPTRDSNRRILFPTDLTASDAFPFQMACALARGLDAELIVMHAAPMKELRDVPGYREEIERRLDWLRRFGADLKITTNLLSGDPASRIVGWANETLCDAIVMRGSRKQGLVGRLVENVSQRVKRLVPCPVILIPGEPPRTTGNREPESHSLRAEAFQNRSPSRLMKPELISKPGVPCRN